MIVHRPAADSGARAHPQVDRTAPHMEAPPRLDGIRVLALDDEPDSLNLLRAVLEGAGATVTTTRTGAER